MRDIKYQFSATLLDAFEGWLHPDRIWEKYWGQSDNPSKSYEDFCKEQEQGLIDRINKVEFISEPASKGTAFNDVVDWVLNNQDYDCKTKITPIYARGCTRPVAYEAWLDGFVFRFDYELVRMVTSYYRVHFDAPMCQVYVHAALPTSYGDVDLHGYIDELKPNVCHDLKTTGSYSFGDFKHHWQHLVYPYCLRKDGSTIDTFSYDIIPWKRNYGKMPADYIPCAADGFYHEIYNYRDEEAEEKLRRHCEGLIEFIEAHKDQIYNEKIFNYRFKLEKK